MSFRLAKGPNYPLFRKFKFFNMATPENYGGSYLKNLCYERPELAYGMTQLFLIIAGITYLVKRDKVTEQYTNRPYKFHFIIMRPDDPRVEVVKRRPAYCVDQDKLPDIHGKPVFDITRTS